MKELRFDADDGIWRVAFAFDPKRRAILHVAGDKSGGSEKRFYKKPIEKADARYGRHIDRLRGDGKTSREDEAMKTLQEKLNALPVTQRKALKQRAAVLVAEELTLQELRKALKGTQEQKAKTLGVKQEQVSRIEKRTDLHISTLRRSVQALGGKLSLVAEFPDRKPVMLAGITSLNA